jgi:hypothetical protein
MAGLQGVEAAQEPEDEYITLPDGTRVRKPAATEMARGGLLAKYGMR